MKAIYVISLISLLMAPFRLMGQYVCYDNDGFTNVRKGPGTQYEIVDKVGKYEVFYSMDWLYFYETPIDTLLTWIPFGRSVFDNIDKFIYGKNIKSLEDMPRIRGVRENDTLISCRNDTISINLVLKGFDENDYIIKDTVYDGKRYIQSIDGEKIIGAFRYHGIKEGETIDAKEISAFYKVISALYIEKGNNKSYLPVNALIGYINPSMIVHLGYENELYIFIYVGDGGESYGLYLSVVDGVIKYTLEWG